MGASPFSQKVIDIIQSIPHGKVATYGSVATLAGNRRAARQVARILHTYSRRERLPWHRVINKEGRISLPKNNGYENQKVLLENEGVEFDLNERIDLSLFLWKPKFLV